MEIGEITFQLKKNNDYLERLYNTITKGVIKLPEGGFRVCKEEEKPDILPEQIGAVCGVVPLMQQPEIIRNSNLFKTLCPITWNKEGNITTLGDDLFALYSPNKIFEIDHVRSSFIMRRSALDKIRMLNGDVYDSAYGKVGFREESDLSLRLKIAGYKLLCDTGAICWHLMCPSGGVRTPEYAQQVQIGDELFRKKVKKWIQEGKLK